MPLSLPSRIALMNVRSDGLPSLNRLAKPGVIQVSRSGAFRRFPLMPRDSTRKRTATHEKP